MILSRPRPQMLMMMTTTTAVEAMAQLVWQLVMAEPERHRPMAIIIGPTTTGGKKRITFLSPKALMSPATTK